MSNENMTAERIKVCIGKLLDESVRLYKEGKDRAAWTIVESDNRGRILLVKWPNDDSINLHWSPITAGIGDLGTLIGAIGTEYFNVDAAVDLLTSMTQRFIEE